MILEDIAPKYFKVEELNTLNVGLFGYVNETIATTTEDTYNTISTYINELIPVRARLPESIYGYATTVQLNQLFANAAEMQMVLIFEKSSIINEFTKSGNKYRFNLDRQTEIFVEDKKFMLDYDIEITANMVRDKIIYTSRYILDHKNMISNIKNPFIKGAEISNSGNTYYCINVTVHQVERTYQEENIINNTIINMPLLTFEFEDKQLAGFNVFYENPLTGQHEQLELRLANTPPIKKPFCYYRFKTESSIEISFTTRDFYFRPEINSNIVIEYFTTLGTEGNFDKYTGTELAVLPKSDKWDYNNNLLVHSVITSKSDFGVNMPNMDQIKSLYLEKMTSIDSYTCDEDLNIYFKNFNERNKSLTRFIKTRDDFHRIYTGYVILKNAIGDVYHTNTLSTAIKPQDFDINDNDNNLFIIKPGRLFTYDGASYTEVIISHHNRLPDGLDDLAATNEFVYTNPFLILISRKPQSVGYYLNSIDKDILTDYSYVNGNSTVQFLCSGFHIRRTAYTGSDKYKISLELSLTSDIEEKIVDKDNGNADMGILKPKFVVKGGESGDYITYSDFILKEYDEANKIAKFEAEITTDDFMTLNRRFRVKNMKRYPTGEVEDRLIPSMDCRADILVFFKLNSDNVSHDIPIDEVADFTLTNKYSTEDTLIDWILPLNIVHSNYRFIDDGGVPNQYRIGLRHMPLVRASTMKDPKSSLDILHRMDNHIYYAMKAVDKITNNYSVDLKFYNTYGRAKNAYLIHGKQLLNRVNMSIEFDVKPNVGTPINELIRDLRLHIKKFMEDINTSVFNSFHVSNLIQSIENTFPDVDYVIFKNFNGYGPYDQSIIPKDSTVDTMSKDQKLEFVPEFMNIELDQIKLNVI
jgi:hypothetical protein